MQRLQRWTLFLAVTAGCGAAPSASSDSAAPNNNDTSADSDASSATDAKSNANQSDGGAPLGPDNRYCAMGDVPSFGASDGPAKLPATCFFTAIAATPSPGAVISVPSGGDIASALAQAKCGDVVELAAGATFGAFSAPAKACDANHYITVRTSAWATLPPEGTRATPCYANVASLPGRPAFDCASPTATMATIASSGTAITLAANASYYRFVGLEVTRTAGSGLVSQLVNVGAGGINHIVFDRSWLHGTAVDETTRSMGLSGTSYFAIIDSYLNDFHCTAVTGSCTDAQSIHMGGLGSTNDSTYKVVNDFLEASGTTLSGGGGGAATTTPVDMEIRRNHMFKPLTWNPSDPAYGGTEFIVKNHFETKNSSRTLLEGNVLENVWGGFSQVGFAVLLTPKNQAINPTTSVCPACQVTDVVFRLNRIKHAGAAMQIANAASDAGGYATRGSNYSVHDNVFDDMAYATCYACNANLFQLTSSPNAPAGFLLHDVLIDHNTIATSNAASIAIFGGTATPSGNFALSFTNNVIDAGKYGVTGVGGPDCTYNVPGAAARFANCWATYAATNNAFVRAAGTWPATNFAPADMATAVGFVNYAGGVGGDYHLQASSPLHNAATDGKDLGADIDALASAIAGVAP